MSVVNFYFEIELILKTQWLNIFRDLAGDGE